MKTHITIVGGGMGGTLMAICLARLGYTIDIYEECCDIRDIPPISNRSINQSLSTRGVRILEDIGLWSVLKKMMLVEKGRTVHTIDGRTFYSPYGRDTREVHYTFNRNTLNGALLDLAASIPTITVHFHMRCTGIDKQTHTVTFQHMKTKATIAKKTDIVIGCDGVHSLVRKTLEHHGISKSRRVYLDREYKSFYIPAGNKTTAGFSTDTFHMWPRSDCFLFAIPNIDGSFIITIILPQKGERSISSLKRKSDILRFFKTNFPDISAIAPLFARTFPANRSGHLECLYTSRWHDTDFAVMIGDACHAVMPFYGQGISATLEDCVTLTACMETYAPDWNRAFTAYQKSRKPNTDVLTDLSTARFVELKDGFRSTRYLAKETIESALSRLFPSFWKPLYSWITHTSIPYAQAYQRYQTQERIARLLGMDLWIEVYARFMKKDQ